MPDTAATFRAELEKSTCRLLWFGVTYGDLRATAEAGSWEAWSERMAERAAHYETLADEASARHPESAGELWRRAAVYYHYAQLKLGQGEAKHRLQERCRESFGKGSPSLSPPARRIEVSLDRRTFPGYLRVARQGAPCVVLVNGLDSAKEVELARFAEGFLARGLSVFCFDGPGQGEGADGAIRSTCSTLEGAAPAVSAALDVLSREGEEGAALGDAPRFGLFGVSFGGHLACRIAALERRIEACVCLGGFFDGSILRRLPPPAMANLARAYGVDPESPLEDLFGRITLAPLAGLMDRPLLVVHGADDHLVDSSQVAALERWAPRAEVRVYRPGEHVCTDRFAECLPMLWDWMADRLGPAADGAGDAPSSRGAHRGEPLADDRLEVAT